MSDMHSGTLSTFAYRASRIGYSRHFWPRINEVTTSERVKRSVLIKLDKVRERAVHVRRNRILPAKSSHLKSDPVSYATSYTHQQVRRPARWKQKGFRQNTSCPDDLRLARSRCSCHRSGESRAGKRHIEAVEKIYKDLGIPPSNELYQEFQTHLVLLLAKKQKLQSLGQARVNRGLSRCAQFKA